MMVYQTVPVTGYVGSVGPGSGKSPLGATGLDDATNSAVQSGKYPDESSTVHLRTLWPSPVEDTEELRRDTANNMQMMKYMVWVQSSKRLDQHRATIPLTG